MVIMGYVVLLAVLLGIGTLVASILPARGARIGLGAVLFLALFVDTTWFVSPLVDWSAPLIDLVLVAIFGLIVLLAVITALIYSRRFLEPEWIWPSDQDILFLAVIVILFGVIIALLPVPLDTDAQGFGYLSLLLREGHSYTNLTPWHPEIDYLYSPGYTGLIGHLSARLDITIPVLQLILAAVGAVLFVWMAYDLGCELESPRLGRAFMLAALIGTGMVAAFMDSHYTALLALNFSLAFVTFVLRFLQSWRWSSVLFAAICLAAVPLSQPDTTIALLIGYLPWLIVLPFAKPRPSLGAWLVLAAIIPLVALGILAPWLLSLTDLLGSTIESPFAVDLDHWKTLIFMHGGLIVLLALIGVGLGLRRRHPAHLWMVVWLIAIVEFSTLGLLEKTVPDVVTPLLKYDYPFSLAWHGPIIPYLILGGTALLWLVDRLGEERADFWVRQLAAPVMILAVTGIVLVAIFFNPLMDRSRDIVNFYGAFSSRADLDAMAWIRDNTAPDARLLNHPGPHEADWAPVVAERDAIYFRPQPFFQGTEFVKSEQDAFRAFWNNPADPDNAALFERYHVDYVLVPQIFAEPDRYTNMVRWHKPLDEAVSYLKTPVSDAPYLRLVYDEDGAQVYQFVPPINPD